MLRISFFPRFSRGFMRGELYLDNGKFSTDIDEDSFECDATLSTRFGLNYPNFYTPRDSFRCVKNT